MVCFIIELCRGRWLSYLDIAKTAGTEALCLVITEMATALNVSTHSTVFVRYAGEQYWFQVIEPIDSALLRLGI